jgi:hypothetical protein
MLPAAPVGAGEMVAASAVTEGSFASFGGSVYFVNASGMQVWRNAWMSTALQRIMANAPTEYVAGEPVEWDETTEEYYADEYD